MIVKKENANKIFPPHTVHIPNIRDVPGVNSVLGIREYKNRIVSILPANNVVLLPEDQYVNTCKLIDYYREYFSSPLTSGNIIKIKMQNQTISKTINDSDEYLELIRKHPGDTIAEFYTSDTINQISKMTSKKIFMKYEHARFLNNKYEIRKNLARNGLPVPNGDLVFKNSTDCLTKISKILKDLIKTGYEEFSITKLNSCSGQGIFRFKNEESISMIINQFEDGTPFIVEGWLPNVISSPSCQILLTDNLSTCQIFGYSEQILENALVHHGNIKLTRFLNNPNFTNVIQKTISHLHSESIRGILGIDLLVCSQNDDSNKIEPYIVEINGRQTGAIYGVLFAKHLLARQPEKWWLIHNNVMIEPGITFEKYINQLRMSKIHYQHNTRKGVIVLSNGNFANNKIMMLVIADDKNELEEILNAASYHG